MEKIVGLEGLRMTAQEAQGMSARVAAAAAAAIEELGAANKKYVDDAIAAAITGAVEASY